VGSADDIDLGVAGASARREHERRRANREQRVREEHPRLGGLILAFSDEPSHQRMWERGAGGEELVARSLAKHLEPDVVVLHDRGIPGSRANIDHIAVAPSGVWVIDSKRYKGQVEISKPLFGRPRLTISGRDKTKLVEGLAKQVAYIGPIVSDIAPGTPIHGALCFVDADLPLIRTLTFNGYPLLYPKRLAKRINEPGPLAQEHVHELARALAAHFRAA
jgi:hypothetical protein